MSWNWNWLESVGVFALGFTAAVVGILMQMAWKEGHCWTRFRRHEWGPWYPGHKGLFEYQKCERCGFHKWDGMRPGPGRTTS